MSLVGEAPVPLFIAQPIGRRHVVVAGGGGAAKTGVKNGIIFYEVKNSNGKISLEEVKFFSTNDYAPMCGYVRAQSLDQFLIAVPKDDAYVNVSLAAYCYEKYSEKNHKSNGASVGAGKVSFQISEIACCITDFAEGMPTMTKSQEYIKTVAIAPTRDYLAIGTTDGVLTVFKIDQTGLRKLDSVRAHAGEIVDLDFHPTDRVIATITRDSCGFVWSFESCVLKKISTFQWSKFGEKKYRYRACRYGVAPDQKSSVFLYLAAVPRVLDKVTPSYLLRWDQKKNFSLETSTKRADEITSLSMSEDGLFLATGSKEGTVEIYTAFNFSRVYRKIGAHNLFVTSLAFLPTCYPDTANLLNGAEVGVVSVSADNRIIVHTVLPRSSFNLIWTVSGAICLIYLFFWSLVYFRI